MSHVPKCADVLQVGLLHAVEPAGGVVGGVVGVDAGGVFGAGVCTEVDDGVDEGFGVVFGAVVDGLDSELGVDPEFCDCDDVGLDVDAVGDCVAPGVELCCKYK